MEWWTALRNLLLPVRTSNALVRAPGVSSGDGGLFSFEVSLCSCGRPMHLPCDAAMPTDYFEDLPYDVALYALRMRQSQELNDSVISEETSMHDQPCSIFANRFVESFAIDLRTQPASCQMTLRIRRVYAWPSALSGSQIQQLSSMTHAGWKRFLSSVPSRLHADIIIKKSGDMLARVFFYVTRVRRRGSPKFKVCRDLLQMNVNGRVYSAQSAQSPRLRSYRTRCIGKCSWTRQEAEEGVDSARWRRHCVLSKCVEDFFFCTSTSFLQL